MNITILNGNPENKKQISTTTSLIYNSTWRKKSILVKTLTLRDLDAGYCTGC
jgi:hypothetical protein